MLEKHVLKDSSITRGSEGSRALPALD